jgi:hypothetical protein
MELPLHPPEPEIDMTRKEKVARRKWSLLELATEVGKVSKACPMMGYSRRQFYEIRRNFQTFGADGLLDRVAGARAPHPNRVGAAIEQAILDHAIAHPCHGPCGYTTPMNTAMMPNLGFGTASPNHPRRTQPPVP